MFESVAYRKYELRKGPEWHICNLFLGIGVKFTTA